MLNSSNTYVAEHLIREAVRMDQAIFFRRYQAGITVAARDPIYSVCDCEDSGVGDEDETGACAYLNALKPCDPAGGNCSVYSYESAQCPAEDEGEFSRNGSLCDRTDDRCYAVDPTSADLVRVSVVCTYACVRYILYFSVLLQLSACRNAVNNSDSATLATVHPEQPSTPAVTVWFNNGVSNTYYVHITLQCYHSWLVFVI